MCRRGVCGHLGWCVGEDGGVEGVEPGTIGAPVDPGLGIRLEGGADESGDLFLGVLLTVEQLVEVTKGALDADAIGVRVEVEECAVIGDDGAEVEDGVVSLILGFVEAEQLVELVHEGALGPCVGAAYLVQAGLAPAVTKSPAGLLGHGVEDITAPPLLRFLSRVATVFGRGGVCHGA